MFHVERSACLMGELSALTSPLAAWALPYPCGKRPPRLARP